TSVGSHDQRAPKLLIVVSLLEFFVSHRLPLALEARRRGWKVIVAAPGNSDVSSLTSHQIEFIPLRFSRSGWNPAVELMNLFSVWKCLDNVHPDIAHLVAIKPVLYGGIACKFLRGASIVASVSGLGYVFTEGGLQRKLLRRLVEPAYRLALRRPRNRATFQ